MVEGGGDSDRVEEIRDSFFCNKRRFIKFDEFIIHGKLE